MAKKIIKFITDKLIYIESLLYSKILPGGRKRVLILRKDGLGDCILFYPTLAAYREYYIDSEVTLIMPKWFEPLSSLLTKFNFDHVIWFDHVAFSHNFSYRRKFLLDLKRQGYDIVIYPVITREPIAEFMIKMTGATEIKVTIPDNIEVEIERDVYFAEQITGKKISLSFPTIQIKDLQETNSEVKEILQKKNLLIKPYAIIFPGAGAAYRIWPADRFAKIIDHITTQNIIPIICGSPKEKDLVQSIISKTVDPANIIDLSGQTNLPTLAQIISHAQFYFGSDTGILHLATAVGTPAVALVGIGGYARFFPYGDLKKNRILYDKTYIEKHPKEIGNWDNSKALQKGEIHPSILGISVEAAEKEVNYMLDFIRQEKP